MAIATAYVAIDMTQATLDGGTITAATATHIQLSGGTEVMDYFGSGFTFANGTVTGGTATSAVHYDGGIKEYQVTGGSYAATTIAGFYSTHDITGLFRYVFAGNDTFNGSSGNDVLAAFGGNDKMYGNGGNDFLYGMDGADLLDGGAGADTMSGGAGNDTYIVNSSGDLVSETTSITSSTDAGGLDTVKSAVTFDLGANTGVAFVERLTLTGSSAINGSGNAKANTINGNNAANVLHGAGGNDTLIANGGSDQLFGDAGADLLRGGAGNDVLCGGTGADRFRFDTALSATTNVDHITDFSVADDTIQLENGIFTAFGSATGTIAAGNLRINATGRAVDANDFLVYESDTGKLFYDADGSGAGAAVQIAVLGTNLALTAADFVLV